MNRQIIVVRAMAILLSGCAGLGASVFVASPWSVAAAYAAKLERMQIEQQRSAAGSLGQPTVGAQL